MLLAASSLGVQSVFMGDIVIAEPIVKSRLDMKGDLIGVVALGYSAEYLPPRGHLIDIAHSDRAVWH